MHHHRSPRKFCQIQILLALNSVSQNVFKEVFRAFELLLGRRTEQHHSSKDEGLRGSGHKVSMVLDRRKSNLGSQSQLQFLIDSLSHFIAKCGRYYYKIRQKFITKCARFFISKCHSFIIKCNVYYKIRRYKV